MNNSGLPLKITTAFASSDSSKNTIPETSTSGSLAAGTASMDVGFPPLTRIPQSSGGIPPHGEDMNGILYSVTNKLQAYDAGAKYPFDSSFAAKIGGYPNGAIVASSDLSGVWLSTIDGNLNNPEGTATTSTNWIPLSFTGISAISIPDANVTMTCLSAARPSLILTGTLTANRYLYIPAWDKEWTVINNCTGLFNVIISTVSGSNTASIQNGKSALIYCDGSSVSLINTVQNATNVTAGVVKIVDNLLSTATDAALTANQGKILNDSKFNTPILASVNCNTLSFIRNSGFSSVTQISGGVFEFTFSSPMSSNNYFVMLTGSWGGSLGAASISLDNSFPQTTTKFRIKCVWGGDNTNGSFSPTLLNVMVIS